MLVLTRKTSEAIVISDNITITVLEVKGNRVKLGFTAPGDTTINRLEVYRKPDQCPSDGLYAGAALV